jgi:hypothetical protein
MKQPLFGGMVLVVLVLVGVLAGCGAAAQPPAQEGPPPTPTAQPVDQATAPPTQPSVPLPTATPTTTPTTATVAVGGLPAPLYVLDSGGQIVRVSPADGAVTTVTSEAGPVTGFDVSPSSGLLAYTVALPSEESHAVVVAAPDGTARRELFRGVLRSPLFLADDAMVRELDPSSDGHQIAYHVVEPLPDVEPERQGPGIFVSLDLGMCPFLLVPDQPEQGQRYAPLALSPDGMGLLLRVGEDDSATMAVLPMADAEQAPVALTRPDGEALPCCEAVWSRDSAALYVADGASLWRVDAASGAATLAAAGPGAGAVLRLPYQAADGTLYAFATEGISGMTMYRLSPNGRWQALRTEPGSMLRGVWAAGGSGAVVLVRETADAPPRLVWLASDGAAAVVLPLKGVSVDSVVRWGP